MVKRKVLIAQTPNEIINYMKYELETRAKLAIEKNGVFHVGLSGGSLIAYTTQVLSSLQLDLTLWKFYFCDERYVQPSSPDSTYGAYKRSLLTQCSHLNLKEEQFLTINTAYNLNECAENYERMLLKAFNIIDIAAIPKFDILLLGMGSDGHICSLFENHAILQENQKLIAAINDSPKEPKQRITMTLPLLNNAICCLFVVIGMEKAHTVQRIFQTDIKNTRQLPAQFLIKPEQIWILDVASAAHLTN